MATQYFIRNDRGEKGPYTRKQMKAAIEARSLRDGTEFRTGEDEAWQPIAQLAKEFADVEAKKREERIAQAPEVAPPNAAPPVDPSRQKARLILLAIVLVVGAGNWLRNRAIRAELLGRPCKVPADCQEQASCLMLIGADRKIAPEGYCTFPCSDASDCNKGDMYCGEAMSVGDQGTHWDGSFTKTGKVCVRR